MGTIFVISSVVYCGFFGPCSEGVSFNYVSMITRSARVILPQTITPFPIGLLKVL